MKHLAAAMCIVCSFLTATGQTTEKLEFDAASVKRATTEDRGSQPFLPKPLADMMGFDRSPGRINYHGVSLKMLLARAYNVKPDQISGPSWLASERYVVEAKMPADTTPDQLRSMLQNLLTERFQIALHREMKDTAVYFLKVAKNGPKLKQAQELPHYENDDERNEAMQKRALENMAKMKAAREANGRIGIRTPSRSFSMARATMEKFAETLSGHLDRPVKDRTQIEGEYSFHVGYDPDSGLHDDTSGLSIFIAIQEQLGLKLEAGNEAIEWLVIDKAEKTPISN